MVIAFQQGNLFVIDVKYLSIEIIEPDAAVVVFQKIGAAEGNLPGMTKMDKADTVVPAYAEITGYPQKAMFIDVNVVYLFGWKL